MVLHEYGVEGVFVDASVIKCFQRHLHIVSKLVRCISKKISAVRLYQLAISRDDSGTPAKRFTEEVESTKTASWLR